MLIYRPYSHKDLYAVILITAKQHGGTLIKLVCICEHPPGGRTYPVRLSRGGLRYQFDLVGSWPLPGWMSNSNPGLPGLDTSWNHHHGTMEWSKVKSRRWAKHSARVVRYTIGTASCGDNLDACFRSKFRLLMISASIRKLWQQSKVVDKLKHRS